MLGYPQLSNYSFNVIECMSSNVFQYKQIGYMTASQSFGPQTEVSMLTTNLVKKDLVSHSSSNQLKSFFNPISSSSSQISTTPPILSITLAALPHLLTIQNYIDLAPDLIILLNHSKPTIRTRAVIIVNTLVKLDLQRVTEEESIHLKTRHPELDRHMSDWIERLRQRLFDDEFSVIQATVNVICELVSLYPWPWLEIAAELYDLLESSENNWLRIKIVKLFTTLMPIEPRLTRKLLPILTTTIHNSSAMSLLNECIHTILAGGLIKEDKLAQTCIEKLIEFLNDSDLNLRYISLIGLRKLIEFHPNLLQSQLNLILDLVSDPDPSLSSKALDLIQESQYDCQSTLETIEALIEHLIEEEPKPIDAMSALLSVSQQQSPVIQLKTEEESLDHKIRIVQIIILIGSYETYSNIRDFEWFIDILIQLSILLPNNLQNRSTEIRISETLIDICSRVIGIREYTVKEMIKVLKSEDLFDSYSIIIKAAIWIIGEYTFSVGQSVDQREVIGTLFKAELLDLERPEITMITLENGVKVFVRFVNRLKFDMIL
ncbi:Clathrin/coatomer adaptor, adaptin-like protein [Melampsora americana]|nr:Clathrin/coatomer adaptor, adaptin-like protein [Melampsora americana]